MVGTPKSSGCQTCRRRKKKCDERRPECSGCAKAGWRCPGYDKRWKFVDENKQVARSYGETKHAPVQASAAELGPGSRPGSRLFEIFEAEDMGYGACHVGVYWPLSSGADRNASVFISILTNSKAQNLLSLQALGSFFPAIPARLGQNRALDAAIACLCSIYIDCLNSGSTPSRTTINGYVTSLDALQTCVKDPTLRPQSETMCASIIVQMCELMTVSDNGQWNNLSRGCQVLFKDCDPNRFVSGFDREMLDSQRAMFIAQDMHAGEDCFLAESRWRAALNPPSESPILRREVANLKNGLAEFLVDIPGVMRESAALVIKSRAPQQATDHRDCLKLLLTRILDIKRKLLSWSDDNIPTGLTSTEHDVPGNSRQSEETGSRTPEPSDSEMLGAVVRCVANAVLVKLDRIFLCISTLLHQNAGIQALGHHYSPKTVQQRELAAQAAFDLVKSRWVIAYKTLEFGLQQIQSHDDLFR